MFSSIAMLDALCALVRLLALWLCADLILGADHLAEPMTVASVEAFLIPFHALVAGGQHLPCVLFPGVERLSLLGRRQAVAFTMSSGDL